MNEQQDIEQQLQALRPVTPDPALRNRIAESLAEQDGAAVHVWSPWHRLAVGLAGAAVVVIAGLVVLQLVAHSDEAPEVVTDIPPANENDEAVPPSAVPARPTLLALHDALRESPQEVDALLDRIGADRLARLASDPRPLFASTEILGIYKELP